MTEMTVTADFMRRLRLIENARLKARDIVVLYAISRQPGAMGQEVAKKLGYEHRSALQSGLRRLTAEKLIEDRRARIDQQTPNSFHVTNAGIQLLAQIVPEAFE